MFRVVPKLRSVGRDLVDSIRFMSKSTKRRLYYGTAVVSSLTCTGLFLSYHTVGNQYSVEHLQMYQRLFPVPVNPNLRELLDATLNDMKISAQENTGPVLFSFVGNEIYSLGSLHLPSGAFIGVPFFMQLHNESQLKVKDLRLVGRYRTKLSAEAPTIKKLFGAMIMTDQAKKYAFAHELELLSSSYFIVKAVNLFCCTLGSFLMAPVLNRKLGFTQKKPLPRICIGVLCFFTVTLAAGSVIDQLLDEWYDLVATKRVLQTATTLSKSEYLTGAIEFYSKLIERNKATFDLLGEYGPQCYTDDGQTRRVFGFLKQSYEPHLILAINSVRQQENN